MNVSLADVGKFVALGGSFSTHAPSDHPKKWPDVWLVPEAAVVPKGTPIQLSPEVNSVTPAPELTVVLGDDLWRASPAEARAAVEGFTVSNDVSIKGE